MSESDGQQIMLLSEKVPLPRTWTLTGKRSQPEDPCSFHSWKGLAVVCPRLLTLTLGSEPPSDQSAKRVFQGQEKGDATPNLTKLGRLFGGIFR